MFPWYVYLAAIIVPMGIVAVINKLRQKIDEEHPYARLRWFVAAIVANILMLCLGFWAVYNVAQDVDNWIVVTLVLIGCALCWILLMIWSGGIDEGQD
jgi:amino acid transporter